MTFQLIAAFLQSVLQLGGSIGPKLNEKFDLVMSAINAGMALIKQGPIGAADLRTLVAEIDTMVAAGVAPSEAQLAAMKARFQAAYNIASEWLDSHPVPTELSDGA